MKREVSPLKKIIEESPKIRALKEKRRKAKKRLALLLCILFVTLVGGFIYAAWYPKLQLTNVVVSGNQVVDTEDVQALVQADLAGRYAYVIPRKNAFLYPKKQIITDLLEKFPRFKTVLVYRQNLTTVLVTATEVRGHALWCGTETENVTNDMPCYFTDDTGKLVSVAPQYSGNVYLRFFGGSIDSVDANPLGKTFVDAEKFQKLLAFETKIAELGFNVRALVLGSDNENAFVIDLPHGKTATIPFLNDADYTILAANLNAALGKPELAAKLKADKAHLQYFDLRFTNKVYYKFDDVSTDASEPN